MINKQALLKCKCPICSDDLQFDKDTDYFLCDCGYVIEKSDWEFECEKLREQEYKFPDVDDNLKALNNL